ncbi:GNAT family N-acetyltransferase [Rouxiella badensis]|uniref:GNAT family N-acetyltransferase n=1 Tax=Rouxiella badensis TaxID=1646377 RepID=UPI0022AAC80A|nr:GNAT family N-acetyltransferase [Rouxiella badensis]WAT08434.1 GNAT family N-acetyltransferase [Rouxiella badensis]
MSQIEIRHVEPEDSLQLHQLFCHEEVYSDTLQLPHPATSLWQKRTTEERPGTYRLVACFGERVIGQITLHVEQSMRRRHVAGFGMAVHPEFQGQGVGSHLLAAVLDLCDNWLNITRVELTVFVDNPSAIALYKKFGFGVEGTSPAFAMRNGKLVDAHHMGRVKA